MQLGDEAIKVLEYLCEKIGITIDWTSNNVMPFLEQLCEKYIKWEISTSAVWLIIWIICLIVGCCFIKLAIKRCKKFDEEKKDSDYWLCIFNWFIVVVMFMCVIFGIPSQVFDIIECMVFPEKTIYDMISYQILLMNSR